MFHMIMRRLLNNSSSSCQHIRRMVHKLVVKILGLEKVRQRRQVVEVLTIIHRLYQLGRVGQVSEKKWMWLCLRWGLQETIIL